MGHCWNRKFTSAEGCVKAPPGLWFQLVVRLGSLGHCPGLLPTAAVAAIATVAAHGDFNQGSRHAAQNGAVLSVRTWQMSQSARPDEDIRNAKRVLTPPLWCSDETNGC